MKKVFNYKLQTKNPTKKEERDFVEQLLQKGYQWEYKWLKSYNGLYGKYDWNTVIKYKWYERILIRVLIRFARKLSRFLEGYLMFYER